MEIRIWTAAYRPFMCGGDVHAPVSATVAVDKPVDVGNGTQVYLVTSPLSGKPYVCESVTGAIVGHSIEQVRKDIAQGDPDLMAQQVADAKERVKKATPLPADEFWRRLHRNRSDK